MFILSEGSEAMLHFVFSMNLVLIHAKMVPFFQLKHIKQKHTVLLPNPSDTINYPYKYHTKFHCSLFKPEQTLIVVKVQILLIFIKIAQNKGNH